MLRLLLVSAILAVSACAQDFERSLEVSSAPDLYASTGSGHIHVYPAHGSQLRIRAHVYAGWHGGGDTEERIRRIVANPPIVQSGNTVRIGEISPENRELYNNITIDYEIAAPESVALNLRSGSGDLVVDHLGRFVKAETGSGSVRIHGNFGPADLHSGSGDIELQQRAQGEVRASTGSGSIRIDGLSGGLLARTGSGDIEANGDLTGPAKLQSGSGSIRLHLGQNAHYTVDASTGSGSIRVPGYAESDRHHMTQSINGGGPALQIQTGSGDVEVN